MKKYIYKLASNMDQGHTRMAFHLRVPCTPQHKKGKTTLLTLRVSHE